jgi:hypothetical protein
MKIAMEIAVQTEDDYDIDVENDEARDNNQKDKFAE